MKSSWLTRFSVVAALAIACVASASQARMPDPSSLPPDPLDALVSDPLSSGQQHSSNKHGGQQGLQQPGLGAPVGSPDSGSLQHRSRKHVSSTGGQANCVEDTPPTSKKQKRHHQRAFPPTTTPCTPPPPDPGVNCVTDPLPISPPIAITPPISHGKHQKKWVPPTTTATVTTPTPTTATVADTTACPDPNSNGSGTTASDDSNGFTDVIASNDPLGSNHHKHPPHRVPEPGTLTLLALGLGSLWLGRRLGKRR
jgi:hypothetical protein